MAQKTPPPSVEQLRQLEETEEKGVKEKERSKAERKKGKSLFPLKDAAGQTPTHGPPKKRGKKQQNQKGPS